MKTLGNEESKTKVSFDSFECTITVDCVVFGFQENELKVLLVKRAIPPFEQYWMLPGGIMQKEDTLEKAIDHVLFNLTGIYGIHKEQVHIYSGVDRHPVKRVVTVSFYALVKPEDHPVVAKDYISDVKWYKLDELPEKWGFDHRQIFEDALLKLRSNLQEKPIFWRLLPEKFTLKELQDLYESILGERFDRRNFRKKILQLDILENTKEKKVGAKGGPELFKVKK